MTTKSSSTSTIRRPNAMSSGATSRPRIFRRRRHDRRRSAAADRKNQAGGRFARRADAGHQRLRCLPLYQDQVARGHGADDIGYIRRRRTAARWASIPARTLILCSPPSRLSSRRRSTPCCAFAARKTPCEILNLSLDTQVKERGVALPRASTRSRPAPIACEACCRRRISFRAT